MVPIGGGARGTVEVRHWLPRLCTVQ
jgi:hypothetical protein